MNVAVVGLWHLGAVTTACLASGKHKVCGIDPSLEVVQKLQQGQPPLFEPGLAELTRQELAAGRLSFTTEFAAVANAKVVWITYDTPVDDADRADVVYVLNQIRVLFPHLSANTLLLISSQMPVGSTSRLAQEYAKLPTAKPGVSFAYSPENLRLGKAISVFTKPDRVVIGCRRESERRILGALFDPFTQHIEWMSVESAEMTKHALNAFLAASVVFINEIAVLCESVGADAKEVERGLKSEARVGPQAYLSPGGAFAGGTLARDVSFLDDLARQHGLPLELFAAIKSSNRAHRGWTQRKLALLLAPLNGKTVAIWGLTYKPGTNTLRRSSALELCQWLVAQGARVQAHDPEVKALPHEIASQVALCPTAEAALEGAIALVVATEWAHYRDVPADEVIKHMKTPTVLDAGRFLSKTLGVDTRIRYFAVGKANLL